MRIAHSFSPTAGIEQNCRWRGISVFVRGGALLCLAAMLLAQTAGCAFFSFFSSRRKNAPVKQDQTAAGLISAERAGKRARDKEFICLIALSGAPFCEQDANGNLRGLEPDIVRALAKELHWKVRLIQVKKESLSAHLRNGYGDIAAGAMDTDLIRVFGFTPVLVYAPAPQTAPQTAAPAIPSFAFLIRDDDPQWRQTLADAQSHLDWKKLLAPYAGKLPAAQTAQPAPAAPPAGPPAGPPAPEKENKTP